MTVSEIQQANRQMAQAFSAAERAATYQPITQTEDTQSSRRLGVLAGARSAVMHQASTPVGYVA